MDKKEYEFPEMQVVMSGSEDVVVTSNGFDEGQGHL